MFWLMEILWYLYSKLLYLLLVGVHFPSLSGNKLFVRVCLCAQYVLFFLVVHRRNTATCCRIFSRLRPTVVVCLYCKLYTINCTNQSDSAWVWRMSGLMRDGTGRPDLSRETKFLGASGDRRNFIFPVELTTSRIGNLTRLIHTLLYVMTIYMNTYIHTYIHTSPLSRLIRGFRNKYH